MYGDVTMFTRAIDASPARCRQGGLRPIHRDELLLGIPMCVFRRQYTSMSVLITHNTSPSDAKCVYPRPSSPSLNRAIFPADYAIKHNLTPFISMQNQYSLVYREEEREMFPTLKVSNTLVASRRTSFSRILSVDVWRGVHPMVASRARDACASDERTAEYQAQRGPLVRY